MNQPLRALCGALLLSLATFVAACTTTNTTTPSPTINASPMPSPAAPSAASSAGAGGACSPGDLALTAGGWSAAAGSRGADVSVENRGAAACTLPAGPSVAIVDDGSNVLLESEPASAEPGPSIEPGGVATFTVLFSNWCEERAALPLHVLLQADGAGIDVPGLEMSADDLPPCNGPGQPASLSANPWEPAS
jgi:hypothetical protein